MALALVRYRFRGRGGVDMFVFLPLATPEVVSAPRCSGCS